MTTLRERTNEMLSWLRAFQEEEQGQDLVEYTLLLFFVLSILIGLTTGFHSSIAGVAAISNSQLAAANTTIQ